MSLPAFPFRRTCFATHFFCVSVTGYAAWLTLYTVCYPEHSERFEGNRPILFLNCSAQLVDTLLFYTCTLRREVSNKNTGAIWAKTGGQPVLQWFMFPALICLIFLSHSKAQERSIVAANRSLKNDAIHKSNQ